MLRKLSLSMLMLVLVALAPTATLAANPVWSISPRDAVLRQVDPDTGATVAASITITLANESHVRGGNGLARHPSTGELYALIRVPSTPFRVLVTLDETTGVATRVGPSGDTGDNFAGLSFASDETLYAITGDGALSNPPETLCTLSLADASANCFLTLGNGSDGEAISAYPTDGLIYHASGGGTPNDPGGEIFEKVNPSTEVVTPVTLSGYDYNELTVLAADGDGFLAADLGGDIEDDPHLLRISDTGAVTFIGDLDHVSRGLAPLPPPVPALSAPGAAALVILLLATQWWVRVLPPRPSRRAFTG